MNYRKTLSPSLHTGLSEIGLKFLSNLKRIPAPALREDWVTSLEGTAQMETTFLQFQQMWGGYIVPLPCIHPAEKILIGLWGEPEKDIFYLSRKKARSFF